MRFGNPGRLGRPGGLGRPGRGYPRLGGSGLGQPKLGGGRRVRIRATPAGPAEPTAARAAHGRYLTEARVPERLVAEDLAPRAAVPERRLAERRLPRRPGRRLPRRPGRSFPLRPAAVRTRRRRARRLVGYRFPAPGIGEAVQSGVQVRGCLVVGTRAELATRLPSLAEVGDPAQVLVGDLVALDASTSLPPALVRMVGHACTPFSSASSSVPRTSRRSLGSRSATARSAPCVVGR